MKGLTIRIVATLAILALAGQAMPLGARSKVKPEIQGQIPEKDSTWVRMVNDSSLVIRPVKDTVPAKDTTAIRAMAEDEPSESELIAMEEAFLQKMDSIDRARRIADSLMVVQDSIIRAQKIADSIRVAREDSIRRVAEQIDLLVEKGDDYSDRYYFAKAYESFLQAEELCTDPEFKEFITERRKQSDYARTHTQKIPDLTVVARALFSVDDFFLYYPLPDKSWRPVDGAPAVYYTGPETEIHLNRDKSLGMIYPMYDGDRMYFASKELPGFGGYDLFYADWNEDLGEWGEPHNMGFPYSSPFDDFLYMRTEDGVYGVFASTRGLGPDGEEVHVYVIKNSDNTTYRAVNKPKELAEIAELEPTVGVTVPQVGADALKARYQRTVDREQDLRTKLETITPEERPTIQAELDAVLAEKAHLEEQILNSGASSYEIDPEFLVSAGVEGSFPFTRKSYGDRITIIFDE